jgi:hypothetical protein
MLDEIDQQNEICRKWRDKFTKLEESEFKLKKEMIIEFAKELDKHNMIKYTICSKVKKTLKGLRSISDVWIQQVLNEFNDEFIDKKKRNITKKEKPEESRADKMAVTVGNDGKQRIEREKPITDRPEFKALNNQLASVQAKNNLLERSNSIIQKIKAEGFDPDIDKTPQYFTGNAIKIKTDLMKFINDVLNKDIKNPNNRYFVSIQSVVPIVSK